MITQVLKEATLACHTRVEQLARSDKIMDGSLTLAEYQQLLQSNYRFHYLLENEISRFLSEHSPGNSTADSRTLLRLRLEMEQRRKTELLQADLQETHALPDENLPDMNVAPVHTLPQALGYWYVMEGATLGGAVIVKQLRKNPHLPGIPFHYYGCYGAATGSRWKAFQQLLIELVDTPEKEMQTAEAAIRAFQWLAEMLQRNSSPQLPKQSER